MEPVFVKRIFEKCFVAMVNTATESIASEAEFETWFTSQLLKHLQNLKVNTSRQRCADSIADWIHERSCVKAANKCPAPPLVSIETRVEIFRLGRISASRMN